MLELNKLYNMDCLQGMREFPDNYFDLLITDPPYGSGGAMLSVGVEHGRQSMAMKSIIGTLHRQKNILMKCSG